MKNLLILVDKIGEKKELLSQFIAERLKGDNVMVTLARFSDLVMEIGDEGVDVFVGDVDIKNFNLVFIRRIDHTNTPLSRTLGYFLGREGIKFFDTTFREVGAAGDKFTSLVRLKM